jgi:hypothetical protein
MNGARVTFCWPLAAGIAETGGPFSCRFRAFIPIER